MNSTTQQDTMTPSGVSQEYKTDRLSRLKEKKPPTAFIESKDWGIYLKTCCQLGQLKEQYDCSEQEAQNMFTNGRTSGQCRTVRFIIAYNNLYAEYSKLFDAIRKSNNRLCKCTVDGPFKTDSFSSDGRLRTYNLTKTTPNTERGTLASPSSAFGDTEQYVTDITAGECHKNRPPYPNTNDLNHSLNKRGQIIAVDTDHQRNRDHRTSGIVSVSEKYKNAEHHSANYTIPQSNSTAIHMTAMLNSSISHCDSTASNPSSYLSSKSHQRACFRWCHSANSRAYPNHYENPVDGIEPEEHSKQKRRQHFELYDKIQEKNGSKILVYKAVVNQQRLEHRARIPVSELFDPSHGTSGRHHSDDIDVSTVPLPIALELVLPKMQKQIEEVMYHCKHIYDPLEVAAELRQTNYSTTECVSYFHRTRTLRDLIQHFLPNEHDLHKKAGDRACTPYVPEQLETKRTLMNSNELKNPHCSVGIEQKVLFDLKVKINALKKTGSETSRKLKSFKDMTKCMLQQIADTLSENIWTLLCDSPRLASQFCEQRSEIPYMQLTKLTQENQNLRQSLRLEENRRKKVFNMMQEFLGNIRVYCRCRAIPQTSICIDVKSIDTVGFYGGTDGVFEQFKFDRVFGGNSSQSDVYAELAPTVCSFLDGYNVCFLTYGGEASGKTYTLLGVENSDADYQGIAHRALRTILVERETRKQNWEFTLLVTVVEIYNDTLTDLLGNETGINLRVDLGLETMMENLESMVVENESGITELLNICRARRRTGRTALNANSSRSHLIIFARLNSKSRIHDSQLCSVLAMCDLAGFEDVIKADTLSDPKLAKEAGHINRSLTALNRVFMSLRTQDPNMVCYRDSKLTYLLKPFFIHSGKCILIVTVRTDRGNMASSQSTLRFGRESRGVTLGRARRSFNIDKLLGDTTIL